MEREDEEKELGSVGVGGEADGERRFSAAAAATNERGSAGDGESESTIGNRKSKSNV